MAAKLPPGVHVDKRTGKLRAVACIGRGSHNRKEKTFPAGTSKGVELCAPPGIREPPLGVDQSTTLEALECREE